MSRFLEIARELLDAAEAISGAPGSGCGNWTVLVAPGGGVSMVAASDWPLESLLRERGAVQAFRVQQQGERLVVEGRAGTQACLLATERPNGAARALLPNQRLYVAEFPRLTASGSLIPSEG